MIYDLHVHSTKSDGLKTRLKLVREANLKGLRVLSFTDHSYIDDNKIDKEYEKEYQEKSNVSILHGVELDVGDHSSMHMLGYDLKETSLLQEKLIELKYKNNEICEQILRNIKEHHGLTITREDLLPYMTDEFITKRVIIEYLLQNGIVKSPDEASLKYTGKHAKSYEKRAELTCEEAIALIKQEGGISVLAHPTTLCMDSYKLDKEIRRLKYMGLDGIEVNNKSKTTASQLQLYKALACKYKLVKTSGSDFHKTGRNPYQIGVNNNDSDDFFKLPQIQEAIYKGRKR